MQCAEVMREIDEAMPKIQAEIKRQMQGLVSDVPFGNSPELSESTQTPTVSGS
jgi:hypothetical protein